MADRPTTAATTHTYRDSGVLGRRFDRLSHLAACAFLAAFFFGPPALGWFPFSWFSVGAFGLFGALMFVTYRRNVYGTCGEIRLGEDGTCELETKGRMIRLRVNDLRAVRYHRETDEQIESYTIHYRGGKLAVRKQMTGFADFLSRLEALNPGVDLASFPAKAWPGLRQTETRARGAVGRFMRTALFPLVVISLLVYLASQTLVE